MSDVQVGDMITPTGRISYKGKREGEVYYMVTGVTRTMVFWDNGDGINKKSFFHRFKIVPLVVENE